VRRRPCWTLELEQHGQLHHQRTDDISDDADHRRPDVRYRRDRHGAVERRQLDGEQHDAGRAGLGALRSHEPTLIGQIGAD